MLSKMTKMKLEKNQKVFWKTLTKISPKNRETSRVSPSEFVNHFQSILTTNKTTEIPIDDGVGWDLWITG